MAGLSSCNDFLTLDPPTQISQEEFYKSEEDMTQALMAAYDVLQWSYFNGYAPIEMLSDILSDDAFCGGGSSADQQALQVLETYQYTALLQPSAIWTRFYSGINRANLVIEYGPGATGDQAKIDRMIAEAHFLRAYYYYQLWRFYGYVPLITKNLIPSEYYTQQQSAPDELYAFLIKELDNEVIGKLPKENEILTEEKGRISNGAAITLKAKIVLYQNDETKMSEIANQLKSIITDNGYTLMPDFSSIWLDTGEHCAESVFEINYTEKSSWSDWSWGAGGEGNIQPIMTGPDGLVDPTNTYVAGWGFCPVDEELYNQFENGDTRLNATIYSPKKEGWKYNERYQNTGYFASKYAPRPGYTSTSGTAALNYKNNVRVFRFSDVLLMAAETTLRSGGNQTDAQEYYTRVVKRAMGESYQVKTVSLESIYKERRLELALEGHRYWDLIRTGKASSVLSGWSESKKYLPIPQSEIDNSQGALKQF